MENFDSGQRETTFTYLDKPFSQTEIREAISSLSANKACGVDNIMNEYFKNAVHILTEPIKILFNKILYRGTFLSQWATGLVVLICKKKKKVMRRIQMITVE